MTHHILDLAGRNDGYLTIADCPVVSELLAGGKITVRYVGDGCLIAKAVPVPSVHRNRTARGRWSRPVGELRV